MLIDHASWHATPWFSAPGNICLISKPDGSPELNPAEHLWKELREKAFSNAPPSSLDALEEEPCAAINLLSDELHNGTLRERRGDWQKETDTSTS